MTAARARGWWGKVSAASNLLHHATGVDRERGASMSVGTACIQQLMCNSDGAYVALVTAVIMVIPPSMRCCRWFCRWCCWSWF